VEVLVPWELSRFQHLNILGQAYILTKDNKYAEEFTNQITDWIRANPIGFGVNWSCTMDVAIRAANWLIGMEYFIDGGMLSQNFLNEFYNSIYEHGKFIRANLECYSGAITNHYLADITGLFFISVYCSFFKESKKWQEFALKELTSEIERQVYPDGCDYEASTTYHLLVLELFFYALLLCERAGMSLSDSYKTKVKKMFESVLYYAKPDGMVPQIGDNDAGGFLKFSSRHFLERGHLLSLAATYFKDSNFKLKQLDLEEESLWLSGLNAKTIWNNLPFRESLLGSKSFPDAGWFIIRHKNDYCFISCGPNGEGGVGGHAHNDKLSFELTLNGQDIILDPGTYIYTPYPEERNKFRSTEYHNTIKFNGYEQNEFSEKEIFILRDRVTINNVNLEEMEDKIIFKGEIQYLAVSHKRTITLEKQSDNCLIKDVIISKKPLNAKLIFHLSPGVVFDNNCIFLKEGGRKIATIDTEGYKLEKGEYDYSPEYGVKEKAECLMANISVGKKAETIITNIYREG
jgi:uncharacterized heparinase superfamily protein